MTKRKSDDMLASKFANLSVVSTSQFDEPMLRLLIATAKAMKSMVASKRKSSVLHGRILANVFYEPSTRTMCSFDAAMKRLGGDVISVSESTSSAKKGDNGSYVLNFGKDSTKENFLEIYPGSNATLRIYSPQEAYFDGSWKVPEIQSSIGVN